MARFYLFIKVFFEICKHAFQSVKIVGGVVIDKYASFVVVSEYRHFCAELALQTRYQIF